MSRQYCAFLSAVALTASVGIAQNHLRHFDGEVDFNALRQTSGAESVYQRYPFDQARCRARVLEVRVGMRDANAATAEAFTVEIRTALASGAPDLTGIGLVAGPVSFTPPVGVGQVEDTYVISIGPCVALPPTGDLWVGVNLPANIGWPLDGLSVLASVGEQHKAIGLNGYSGAAFDEAGLAWWTGSPAFVAPAVAWDISLGLCEDVCQPFAVEPRFGVKNPNYGYAGIFPGTSFPDAMGVRLRSQVAVGRPVVLLLGLNPIIPICPLSPFHGCLCIAPIISLGSITIPALPGLATSKAMFPLGPSINFGNTVDVLAQTAAFAISGDIYLSTACRISL